MNDHNGPVGGEGGWYDGTDIKTGGIMIDKDPTNRLNVKIDMYLNRSIPVLYRVQI